MEAAAPSIRHDARILCLVGAGHFASHFYNLALPPLFPLLKDEFGVDYLMLGLIMTLFNGASAVVQIPVGFLVDRIGARPVLVAGLVIEASAIGLMAFSSSIGALLVLAVAAGAGNSVFHPANYAILNSAIDHKRIGRAFSLHTFAGHLGTALAPMTVIGLTALWDWRTALAVLAAGGLAVAAFLAGGRELAAAAPGKRKRREERQADGGPQDGFALLLSAPMLAFFLFFMMTSMTSNGIRSFSVVSLVSLFDTPLALASTALTGFLFATAAGILVGGIAIDRTSRPELLAAGAFVLTAAIILVVGSVSLPGVLLFALFTLAGLCQGVVRPARDMMVRAVAPAGATGKAFGFVSTGLNIGGAMSPVLFGWIVDLGDARWVFWLLAGFMIVALATLAVPARRRS
mgnify:CR=1 FL=1